MVRVWNKCGVNYSRSKSKKHRFHEILHEKSTQKYTNKPKCLVLQMRQMKAVEKLENCTEEE